MFRFYNHDKTPEHGQIIFSGKQIVLLNVDVDVCVFFERSDQSLILIKEPVLAKMKKKSLDEKKGKS